MIMLRLLFALAVFGLLGAPLSALELDTQPTAVLDGYKVEAFTTRESGVYRPGETVAVRAWVTKDGQAVPGAKLHYSYSGDHGLAGKGEIVASADPAMLEIEVKKAGGLLVKLDFFLPDGRKIYARAGALIGAEELRPGKPEPEDFDAFWNEVKREVLADPGVPAVSPVEAAPEYKGKIEAFDVQIPLQRGGAVSACLTKPAGMPDRKYPALITWHAAGVRSALIQHRYAAMGLLVLDVNAHGLPNWRPGKEYGDLYSGPMKNYRLENADSREKIYFNGMFRRLIRAVAYLQTRPDWDGKTLIVYGASQGGAQALVAAGLFPEAVTGVIALEPALCDHGGVFSGRRNGWPNFIAFKQGKPSNPAVADAVPYYDAVYFAARITRADVLVVTGLIDGTCPPTGVRAAFNVIPSEHKQFRIFPQAIHGMYPEFDRLSDAAIAGLIK